MQRAMISSWKLGFAVLLLAWAGGFAGALHPIGDSLAVFQLPLSVALLVWALPGAVLTTRKRTVLTAGLALALIAVSAIPFARTAPVPEAPFTLYQKNMLFLRDPLTTLGTDIAAAKADAATLQEVSDANRALLEGMRGIYPYQLHCRSRGVIGTSLISRWPILPRSGHCARGIAMARIDGPAGPVWVISLHLNWPWPWDQRSRMGDVQALLQRLDGPVVMGGDFNMVPWGHSVRRIARAGGLIRVQPVRGTFDLMGRLPLPIDHVFAPGGGSAELRAKLGSDHRGLLARVKLTAE